MVQNKQGQNDSTTTESRTKYAINLVLPEIIVVDQAMSSAVSP